MFGTGMSRADGEDAAGVYMRRELQGLPFILPHRRARVIRSNDRRRQTSTGGGGGADPAMFDESVASAVAD